MKNMDSYLKAAVERAMKVQEVILRKMAKKVTGWRYCSECPWAPTSGSPTIPTGATAADDDN